MNYLQKYQQSLGLATDGVVGPKTTAAMMKDMGWGDPKAFVHGMGQAKLESGNFTFFRENLNYSAKRILDTFNHGKTIRFTKKQAEKYGRTDGHLANPVMIANIAYANRGGNGDAASGHGWLYRGGLAIQVTFRDNWLSFFDYLGLPQGTDPNSMADSVRAYFMSIKFYFDTTGTDQFCTSFSDQCMLDVGRMVNVGRKNTDIMPHDWQLRAAYTREIAKTSGVA